MKIHVLIRILVGVLVFAAGPGMARGAGFPDMPSKSADVSNAPAVFAGYPWTLTKVQSTGGTGAGSGAGVSIAVDAATQTPYISYYDSVYQDLSLANPMKAGEGNCGPANDWQCQVVDGADQVGARSSIDIHQGTDSWDLGIAYFDATHAALKYALYHCVMHSCSWSIVTVSDPISGSVGSQVSLKFDSQGRPHIAYNYVDPLGVDGLHYAHPVESGGNCGLEGAAGRWQCDVILSAEGVGSYVSLDLNGSDQPVIAFYDSVRNTMNIARYFPNTGCWLGNKDWACREVDAGGLFLSLHVSKDSPEMHSIAYYDPASKKLKFAWWAGFLGNPNCGGGIFGYEYRCEEIAPMGGPLLEAGISLAVDLNGEPLIAYQDVSGLGQISVVKIARRITAYGLNAGNCGPILEGTLSPSWQCDTVDPGSATRHLGNSISAASSFDLGYIAYTEDDLLQGTSLRYAFQRPPVFLPLMFR